MGKGDDYNTPKSRKEKRKNPSEKKASFFQGGKYTSKGSRNILNHCHLESNKVVTTISTCKT
jgi:hypothetical protein